MENLFKEFNINLTLEQEKKFEKYYGLLIEYNEKFNITAITEKREVYIKHFVDSIINSENLSGKTLIDIGSGGGFPAIPLKIVNENLSLTLVEATNKKCEFLSTVVKELELKDVKVINGRAEELAFDKNFREKFDLCSARAVARLNVLCEYCLPFVKLGGEFISYKGDAKEEILEAQNSIKTLGGKIEKVNEFLLDGANRTLIYIKKEKQTDNKYPRSNGKIKKKPL